MTLTNASPAFSIVIPTPTPYPAVNVLLADLLTHFQTILADSLIGIYLYGSLVTGDWDESSDVDLLVVTENSLTLTQFDALYAMHDTIVMVHPEWHERIEVEYLSRYALATFQTQTHTIGVISPGEPFHFKEMGADWLPNWYVVREQGVTLFGPPPHDLIPPITTADFVESIRGHVRSWGEWLGEMPGRPYQSYAILTLCRAYYTVTHGEQVSKQKAALWTAAQFPDWSPLIHNALHWRRVSHEPADPTLTLADTRKFVAFMQAQIS